MNPENTKRHVGPIENIGYGSSLKTTPEEDAYVKRLCEFGSIVNGSIRIADTANKMIKDFDMCGGGNPIDFLKSLMPSPEIISHNPTEAYLVLTRKSDLILNTLKSTVRELNCVNLLGYKINEDEAEVGFFLDFDEDRKVAEISVDSLKYDLLKITKLSTEKVSSEKIIPSLARAISVWQYNQNKPEKLRRCFP